MFCQSFGLPYNKGGLVKSTVLYLSSLCSEKHGYLYFQSNNIISTYKNKKMY